LKYGFVLPYGDARTAADLAYAAERAGWDGFFVWEPVWGVDAWVSLAAAAMCTERIRLGTLITPVSRMRPWKLASETAALDNLSNGRLILGVGLGFLPSGFAEFGEVTDRKARAELLDEGLDILTGLWQGQPFSYTGKHYTVEPLDHYAPPPPVQQPRIPIWVVGAWPSVKSMQRAARYDGLLPTVRAGNGDWREPTLEELRGMGAFVSVSRTEMTPYDIIIEGETPGADRATAACIVRPWAEAGATWWIEGLWAALSDPAKRPAARRRIEQGPPRVD
jgi:alkanesulfonate monooxygenase SsuD/methylene tetrahydromethanopterin reductase-like flavin-dependent oxidoreductase (luciferase family)